jgi:hypothetical protein
MSNQKYTISHGSGEIIWGRYPVLWLHRRDSGSAEPGWREQSANDLNGHGPRVGLAPHRIPYAGAPKRSSPDASSGCLRVHGTQIKAAGRPAYGRWHGTESARSAPSRPARRRGEVAAFYQMISPGSGGSDAPSSRRAGVRRDCGLRHSNP